MAVDVAMHANSECVARAVECEDLRCDQQCLVSIQPRSGQLNVRRNQVVAAELKSYLLKNARCLQFRAAISNVLDSLGIQSFCVQDLPGLQQFQFNLFRVKGRLPEIDDGRIL